MTHSPDTQIAAAEAQYIPPVLHHTEIIKPLQAEAYLEVMSQYGPDSGLALEVVAGPGDTITVCGPKNGQRQSNHRDKGDLLGVNLDESAALIAGQAWRAEEIIIPEDQIAIELTLPGPKRKGDVNYIGGFYDKTNAAYDRLKKEQVAQRIAKAVKPAAEQAQQDR